MRASLETPILLDVNVRAGGNLVQTDFNINASRLNGPGGLHHAPSTSEISAAMRRRLIRV